MNTLVEQRNTINKLTLLPNFVQIEYTNLSKIDPKKNKKYGN